VSHRHDSLEVWHIVSAIPIVSPPPPPPPPRPPSSSSVCA
jgi:hypothetical protein